MPMNSWLPRGISRSDGRDGATYVGDRSSCHGEELEIIRQTFNHYLEQGESVGFGRAISAGKINKTTAAGFAYPEAMKRMI